MIQNSWFLKHMKPLILKILIVSDYWLLASRFHDVFQGQAGPTLLEIVAESLSARRIMNHKTQAGSPVSASDDHHAFHQQIF